MLKTLQLQGFKWPHMKRDVRDFVCTPCERAYKLRSSNMEPYCDPWDTSTLTAQWGVDLFFLPDDVAIVNARSRSSKHWRALLTTTRCTARDVLAFLRDEVVDSPFFDVKSISGDCDPRYTEGLTEALRAWGVRFTPGVPNRHGNPTLEGFHEWLRTLVGKTAVAVGGWAALRPQLPQYLARWVAAHDEAIDKSLGWRSPDQWLVWPGAAA